MSLTPKMYSDQWLKALRLALEKPSFHVRPAKNQFSRFSVTSPNAKSGNLTDKEWVNYQIAIALINEHAEKHPYPTLEMFRNRGTMA